MSCVDIHVCGTPCCGGVSRSLDWNGHAYDERDERELAKAWALAELGYCPDCGQYIGDLDDATLKAIGFRESLCAGGTVVHRARWDYHAAVEEALTCEPSMR